MSNRESLWAKIWAKGPQLLSMLTRHSHRKTDHSREFEVELVGLEPTTSWVRFSTSQRRFLRS